MQHDKAPQPSPQRCRLCGLSSSRDCGVRLHLGARGADLCPMPDHRLAVEFHTVGRLGSKPRREPMPPEVLALPPQERPLAMARLALARLERCGAHARQTGKPCGQFPMANGRCRLHGGKSTGPDPKHGRRSRAAKQNRQLMHVLLSAVRATQSKLPALLVVEQG